MPSPKEWSGPIPKKEVKKMKKAGSFAWVLVMTALMLTTSFILLNPDEDINVEAKASPTTDAMGYTWIDNQGSDPKVEYDWMDIRSVGTPLKTKISGSSTYRYYYYAISPYEQLGFNFPYYGSTYTQIQVYPNGVLGFADSQYGYAIYNYGGNFPSKYTYTPPGTIAAYWCYYAAPLKSDTNSDIWVYKGATEEGMKYWVCTWANVNYYGTSSAGATFQVILYENGEIKINIQESQSYTSSYLTVGIQNIDFTIGLTYSYASILTDGRAILFKQFATDVYNTTFSPGYGIDENIYPAQAGQGRNLYWASARAYIETNVESLTTFDMTIGSGSNEENIILRYNFKEETFQKLNDGTRVVYFDPSISSMSLDPTDPEHYVLMKFYFDFNFNWGRYDMVSIKFTVRGNGVRTTSREFEDVFRVETRVKMEGNITITDSRGILLNRGDWVKGGDYITFTGVTRKYADPAIPIQPPDMISIAIKDRTSRTFSAQSADLIDLKVFVDPNYNDMEYWLEFVNVTELNDQSDPYYKGFRFIIQVDSDKPGLPGGLEIKPDSKDDRPQNYDDDRDVYLSWKDAVDQSSGIAMYHISVNKDKDEARLTGAEIHDIPKGTYTDFIEGLHEGVNKIYIWAEDNVGNEGNSIFIDVIIDLSPVYFTNFYPVTGAWISTLRPTCSVLIHDKLTGVDPISIEYEISTEGEVGLVGDWQSLSDPYAPGEELRVVVSGWFKNGKNNWIRFRAKDMAGNSYQESPNYNVWIDAKSPYFNLLSHSEDEYHLDPFQEVRVQIVDEESGVESDSIEYRVSTQGLTKWSQWMPYKDAQDGTKPVVTLRENFRRGDQNYIQVRAMDKAGNPVSVSKAFNIKINTYPVIVVSTPSSGDRLVEGQEIFFDATTSYDPDGDRLTISWYISDGDGQASMGDAFRVSNILDAGDYTVTVVAKDRVNNEARYNFRINVDAALEIKTDGDTDLDGLPDSWENTWQTNYLVKDAQEDPDDDGFSNKQEFENSTNPKNPYSHPAVPPKPTDASGVGPFSEDSWPLWALLGILILAVLLTMVITKSKKDRAVKRIKTVRNMRKIMPSVSWDQITTTAYMAPMTAPALQAPSGPALPPGMTVISADQALPPAQDLVVQPEETPNN
ncbi:MAG: PKD domain-containing protein [Thermoplasmatota archaeon]